MLTRLKVNGFKNLIDVDIRFGPFTCIVGGNGVGKSNLFDAIHFLSLVADKPLMDAALCIRTEDGKDGRNTDIRNLFHRVGDQYAKEMTFEAEMLVPYKAVDGLGQEAKATITSLRYSLCLAYREPDSARSIGSLELKHEKLEYITKEDARKNIGFKPSKQWLESVLIGRKSRGIFISTKDGRIKLHQDQHTGRPSTLLAETMPRTLLSTTNAGESPTAFLAQHEMMSWRQLHLEPSAMRKPDEFVAPSRLGSNGNHLPATLERVAHLVEQREQDAYAKLSNRLMELLDDVRDVRVERDEKREIYTLQATETNGTVLPARALSDGTLRFLALAVLELDPEEQGFFCFEEPENGIHPQRIPNILNLLDSIACDTAYSVDWDNPFRQVIVNTHSPTVVQFINQENLVFAQPFEGYNDNGRFTYVKFQALNHTWRTKDAPKEAIIAPGDIAYYLKPAYHWDAYDNANSLSTHGKRIMDNDQLRLMLEGNQ